MRRLRLWCACAAACWVAAQRAHHHFLLPPPPIVSYANPKIVAGCVVGTPDGRVLMVQRSIEPRKGCWGLPAGFLENGESVAAGAAREVREEALADVVPHGVVALISVPRISQIHVYFAASFRDSSNPEFGVGIECEDVALVHRDDLEWDTMAFPTGVHALRAYLKAVDAKEDLSALSPLLLEL